MDTLTNWGLAAGNRHRISLLQGSVAGAAPLNSPTFTGDPKAPTPPTADNDTSIATTAFVKNQGYITGNQTITLSGDIAGSGTTAITTTLPTVNSNVGTFAIQTINAKGLVTAAANMTGDVTTSAGAATLATVNSNVGTFQGITVNGKGLVTAAANQSYAPLASPVFTGTPSLPSGTTAGQGLVYSNTLGAHNFGFGWNGALWAYIDGSQVGQVQFVSSDASLKTNFAPVSIDPLAVINQITLQQFDWLPQSVGSEVHQRRHWSCGYTAQDIQKLIPEAVMEGADAPLGVDLMPLVAHLIGAVQQLSARLAAIEQR